MTYGSFDDHIKCALREKFAEIFLQYFPVHASGVSANDFINNVKLNDDLTFLNSVPIDDESSYYFEPMLLFLEHAIMFMESDSLLEN